EPPGAGDGLGLDRLLVLDGAAPFPGDLHFFLLSRSLGCDRGESEARQHRAKERTEHCTLLLKQVERLGLLPDEQCTRGHGPRDWKGSPVPRSICRSWALACSTVVRASAPRGGRTPRLSCRGRLQGR